MGSAKPAGKRTTGATRTRTREDADEGVRKCVDLMVTGQWVPGASHVALAEEFGVSPVTVKDWATSASRVIRLAVEAPEHREAIRSRLVATLDTVLSKALGGSRPDLKCAVMALAEQGRLLGLVTQKVDVTSKPSVAGLTKDEHRAELAKLRAEIDAECARLEGGDGG